MLYTLIEHQRNIWLSSDDCPVKDLITYMEGQAKLRDAQLECVKTFLYLKIDGQNKPIWQLMYEGKFNSLNLDEEALKTETRNYLRTHPGAQALYEYALSKNDLGQPFSKALADLIAKDPSSIDYEAVLKKLFGDISYADYLFSIPMGAGKTWLMAIFVYLNLYFAVNEPGNKIFAHNFAVVVPAGLKSSIIPSLKDIQDFDPSFIFPPETAKQLKRLVKYEVLEDSNSAKGSNTVKNPNAVKVQSHQPFDILMGLVLITNVEKLYDKIDNSEQFPSFYDTLPEDEKKKWMEVKLANELREVIGKLPGLCIMIDEVQHAKDESLRIVQVVSQWVKDADFNSVLGFSGTPYFTKPDVIEITPTLKIKMDMFGNVVTYYPLTSAIGNFLKVPSVRHSDGSGLDIIRTGVSEFLTKYKDLEYPKVGKAKLAIYCGLIDRLEEDVYPLVCEIVREFGLSPDECILRYYGNTSKSEYKCAPTAQNDFRSLDSTFSKHRIILLAQIGKEGWNCKSLTSVILPMQNSSVRNMVLQTSCRCLREVSDAYSERALIWTSQQNYDYIEQELKKNHHSSIAEITKIPKRRKEVQRYSRQEVVNLPALHYFQFHVNYSTITVEKNDVGQRLLAITPKKVTAKVVMESDFSGRSTIIGQLRSSDVPEQIEFKQWLHLIAKESFGQISFAQLMEHGKRLRDLFDEVSYQKEGMTFLDPEYRQVSLRSDIRKCFVEKTTVECNEEAIPAEASLLKVESLMRPYIPAEDRIIYPDADTVERIIQGDKSDGISPEVKTAIDSLRNMGQNEAADAIEAQYKSKSDERDKRTYQYIPYSFDSGLESSYYSEILRGMLSSFKDVEVYFNGDESLSDFFIECYSQSGKYWKRIGNYFPDFLILRRNESDEISKVILAETKGRPYEDTFAPKKDFMEKFIALNKDADNRTKFDFLYIPENLDVPERYEETKNHIEKFLYS